MRTNTITLGTLFTLLLVPAASAVTETFINISGTATGPGTITVQLKEAGGKVIGSYAYTAAAGEDFEDIADGLKGRPAIPGYKHRRSSNKTEGGIRKSVFKVKAERRGGGDFTVNLTETIPGITAEEKDTASAVRTTVFSDASLPTGTTQPIDLIGEGTTWLSDDITALDFGEGVEVDSFVVISDTLMLAELTVLPDSPTGPESVDVLGNYLADNGQVEPDTSLDSSLEPFVVTGPSVPAVSRTGVIVLVLLLAVGAAILIRRRAMPAT